MKCYMEVNTIRDFLTHGDVRGLVTGALEGVEVVAVMEKVRVVVQYRTADLNTDTHMHAHIQNE